LAVQLSTASVEPSQSRRLAAAVAGALAASGCDQLFGVPGGGHNLDLIGAADDAGIEFVLARTETAAALMAAAYAEVTGQIGACVVTRGPGAASVVNGVAHAALDRIPLIVVTDAISSEAAVRNTHQLLDQQALFTPLTKWSLRLGSTDPETTLEAALDVARRAPAGPVHIDFMPDYDGAPTPLPSSFVATTGDRSKAQSLIANARSPVVAVGVGAGRAATTVAEALARLSCPIVTTYKAKGIVAESSPAAAGLLTGATIEAPVLDAADLIVALGVDPVELIPGPWPYAAPVLSLAEWPTRSRYFEHAAELIAPLEETIGLLRPLEDIRPPAPPRQHLLRSLAALDVPSAGLRPQDVVKTARAAFPAGTIATVDSGAHMLVAMSYWLVDAPGEALISSGLATMGFALPAAIAAGLARHRRVVCFTGDGGLGMALAELETVARLALPVTVIVFNDAALSLIKIKQGAGQGGPRAVRFNATDLSAVARGLGCAATRVTTVGELGEALAAARSAHGPYLIDALVDPSGYRAILEAVRGERA
jgi:acetolactate synthase I/II/III large subunit